MRPIVCLALLCLLGVASARAQQPPVAKRAILNPELAPFYHGVASGDPLTDRVILWTRVTPSGNADSIAVQWQIAQDTAFAGGSVLQSGTFTTHSSRDYTVKVDVQHLQPGSWYYYRFIALGDTSIIGRTRTMPQGDVEQMRIGVASCSDYIDGYFTAYNAMAQRNDLDLIVHLGDYIYEKEDANIRTPAPEKELIQLSDYRERHAQYKLDPDLIRAHQQYPWITVWDDHETANNAYETGAENHEAGEGPWAQRKAAGVRAYHEWMPIRPDTSEVLYRKIELGNLADLLMLDTRLEARDRPIQNFDDNQAQADDSTRRLLGEPQFQWLSQQLKQSQAKWKLLGNQVMMAPLRVDAPPLYTGAVNSDQWDGYAYARQRLFDTLQANNIDNMVVLTGDIHTHWANDLPLADYNPDSGQNAAGVEFVVNSISNVVSLPQDVPPDLARPLIFSNNAHIKYAKLEGNGYYVLTLDSAKAQADYYMISTTDTIVATDSLDASWQARNDSNRLSQANGPAPPSKAYPPLAPAFDDQRDSLYSGRQTAQPRPVLTGAYPNPFRRAVTLQIITYQAGPLRLRLRNQQGRVVYRKTYRVEQPGLLRRRLTFGELPAGTYILQLQSPAGKVSATRLIKH
jgi:alkaline phosphatase D